MIFIRRPRARRRDSYFYAMRRRRIYIFPDAMASPPVRSRRQICMLTFGQRGRISLGLLSVASSRWATFLCDDSAGRDMLTARMRRRTGFL